MGMTYKSGELKLAAVYKGCIQGPMEMSGNPRRKSIQTSHMKPERYRQQILSFTDVAVTGHEAVTQYGRQRNAGHVYFSNNVYVT